LIVVDQWAQYIDNAAVNISLACQPEEVLSEEVLSEEVHATSNDINQRIAFNYVEHIVLSTTTFPYIQKSDNIHLNDSETS